MSKLSAMADRIAAKKASHDAKADEWANRLDELDKLEPTAFAAADAVLTEREDDLASMERDIRKLSNSGPPGPLSQSSQDAELYGTSPGLVALRAEKEQEAAPKSAETF